MLLIFISSCSTLPKNETCNIVEKTQGRTDIQYKLNDGKVERTVIRIPSAIKYHCSDGVDYWVNGY